MNLVNDCVKWLENLAEQYGVNIVETDKLPPTAPSSSYKAKNLIILNLNTKNSLAYELAHELGHLLLTTANHKYHALDEHNEFCESKANQFALRLIYSYCLDTHRCFKDLDDFANSFQLKTQDVTQYQSEIYLLCGHNLPAA